MKKEILYKTDIIVASWNKDINDFQVFLISTEVDINNNDDALSAAKKVCKNYNIIMYRHIAVFDNYFDDNSYTISNLMFAIVEDVNTIKENHTLQYFNSLNSNDENFEKLLKAKTIIEYDIYSQIFDTQHFTADFITALLGEMFTTSDLIKLAKWANRKENKTTFYRNIDNNYQFVEKIGRNKFYKKK